MTHSDAWLLVVLLGFLWKMPVWGSTPVALCTSLRTLKESLNFTNRRNYMLYNFPINYTIKVHHEEVLRLSNISKLKERVKGVEDRDLQGLWLLVNQEAMKKVLRVLPERHPSRRYTSSLEELFRKVQQVFETVPRDEDREPPGRILKISHRVRDSDLKVWKWVKPKALLDNCYRAMHCLFTDCFLNEDYCSDLHWKKGEQIITASRPEAAVTEPPFYGGK